MIDKNKIPIEVLQVVGRLRANGYRSYLVGGSIRDLLLGKNPKDFDICTAAAPEDVKKLFNRVLDTGLKFGTVTVLFNGVVVEVTTFRKKNSNIANGQRQSVLYFGASAEEDVQTRDFSVNGLLFDGEQIIDYVNGQADLSNKVIRAIGEPDCRFKEDALRMLRAIRLSCQLDFFIEPNTFESIISNAKLIKKVAQERIRDELIKILVSDFPSRGIRQIQETGLLQYVLPELQACYRFDQRNPHHDKDVFEHILVVLENTPNHLTVRLAALLHDVAKPKTFTIDQDGVGHFYKHNIEGYKMARDILTRLKFDNKTVEAVGILVKEHMSRFKFLRKSTVKKLINRVGVDNMDNLIELQIADKAGSAPPYDFQSMQNLREEVKRIIDAKEPLSLHDLMISGDDLIELGIEPGPKMGKILHQILEKVLINPELNTKDKLLSLTRESQL